MNSPQTKIEVDGFLKRLNGESPRSRILLETGYIEKLLRKAVLGRLVENKSSKELFGENCSFGLTSLSRYSHALGLIGDHELNALIKLAKAQNSIAHAWDADFTDPKMQKLAKEIQLIVVKGEDAMAEHQKCFARLDYLGLYLTEEFLNRFSDMPPTSYEGGVFLTSLVVDPADGSYKKKTSTGT